MNTTPHTEPIALEVLDSEDYVQQLIHEQDDWISTYGTQLPHIREQINHFLSENTEESLNSLFLYIREHNIPRNYESIPEVALLIVMVTIYQSELMNPTEHHIFSGVTSIDLAIKHFNTIKFLLIDLEWDFDREYAIRTLTNMINTDSLSIIELTYMIQASNINKGLVCDELIASFIRSNMPQAAAQLEVNKKQIA
ncbi:MAG: hypothetical protein PHW47_04665 [Lachnospira sp.]|nr:hypothetical protein [Lachnospira sp.]